MHTQWMNGLYCLILLIKELFALLSLQVFCKKTPRILNLSSLTKRQPAAETPTSLSLPLLLKRLPLSSQFLLLQLQPPSLLPLC